MRQLLESSESRTRIAFDQSLDLHSFASSVLSAIVDAIGEGERAERPADRKRLKVFRILDWVRINCSLFFFFFSLSLSLKGKVLREKIGNQKETRLHLDGDHIVHVVARWG